MIIEGILIKGGPLDNKCYLGRNDPYFVTDKKDLYVLIDNYYQYGELATDIIFADSPAIVNLDTLEIRRKNNGTQERFLTKDYL